VAAALPVAVRAALAGALQQVELLRGTRLFPVRLDVMPQQHHTPATGDHVKRPGGSRVLRTIHHAGDGIS
jgi:hypothetical protein